MPGFLPQACLQPLTARVLPFAGKGESLGCRICCSLPTLGFVGYLQHAGLSTCKVTVQHTCSHDLRILKRCLPSISRWKRLQMGPH